MHNIDKNVNKSPICINDLEFTESTPTILGELNADETLQMPQGEA